MWQRLMSFFFKNYTSMSQFLFVYIVRQKRKKKFADFIKKNLGFLKFSKIEVCYRQILKIRSSINLPWSHDLFSRFFITFIGYKQTNTQTPKQSIYLVVKQARTPNSMFTERRTAVSWRIVNKT